MDTETRHGLAAYVIKKVYESGNRLVAIAGPPAGGKSTLAEELCDTLVEQNVRCSVVPMDGFHLDNAVLNDKNLRARKGSPPSFDAHGFVHAMRRIHQSIDDVYMPVFDRSRDIAIAGKQCVRCDDEVVLVEGNYLFLTQEPWNQLRELFGVRFFINPGLSVVEDRILQRWRDAELPAEIIQARTYENDLPNARTVIDESDTVGAVEFDPTRDFLENLR